MNLAKKLDEIVIERTYSTEAVRFIMSDEELFKRSGHDDISVYDPNISDDVVYLLAKRNEEYLGLIVFHQFQNKAVAQIHANYLPEYWGTNLSEVTKSGIEWIFENTDFEKVIAFAPENYPEVERHALSSGLNVVCTLNNSIELNGKLISQKLMEIDKGES